MLSHPDILAIAARHGKSAANVVLRWHLQLGGTLCCKSVTPARIRDNYQVTDLVIGHVLHYSVAGVGLPAGRGGHGTDHQDERGLAAPPLGGDLHAPGLPIQGEPRPARAPPRVTTQLLQDCLPADYELQKPGQGATAGAK